MAAQKNNKKQVSNDKPVALILAGYDKFDFKTKLRLKKEIIESYEGDEIFLGSNKFLYDLDGKPVIQYVLDAVHSAKKNGKPIYDKIYVYNDVESFEEVIDVGKYANVYIKQMKDSVGGHWKDFYFNHIEYGDRVDVFFGDTPRITPEDVEYLHETYSKIIGIKKDHRDVIIRMLYGIVTFADLKDHWFEHRIKYVKHGKNKGKLKSFVGMENYQARVGNCGAIIKHHSIDELMEHEAINLFYNIRKALTPSNFSRIMYLLWKNKHLDMVRQVKNKCIVESHLIDVSLDIISKLYKIDLSEYAGAVVPMKKNAAHWENDVDGPKDLEVFRTKFAQLKGAD